MYDQVIPAVQDILRRIPEQTESEGKCERTPDVLESLSMRPEMCSGALKYIAIILETCNTHTVPLIALLPLCPLPLFSLSEAALEEICRSDGDEADDVDIHTAS